SPAEARWLCETLAEKTRKELGLSPEYCLAWLREMPAPRALPGEDQKPGPDSPPPDVAVILPVVRDVVDYQDFTGRTQAVAAVEFRARVTGYLDKILFKEGAEVQKGDVLFEIDPRLHQAELARADAGLALSEARRKLADTEL